MDPRKLIVLFIFLVPLALALPQFNITGNVIHFEHTLFNITVYFEQNGKVGSINVLEASTITLPSTARLLNISYDNGVSLEITSDSISDGVLHLSGLTDSARYCVEHVKEVNDMTEDNCYTNVTVYAGNDILASTRADIDGKWEIATRISPDINSINVEAVDFAGNTITKSVKLDVNQDPIAMMVYYVNTPKYQYPIVIGVLILLAIMLIIHHGRSKALKREEEIKSTLTQLFEDERLILKSAVGDDFMEVLQSDKMRTSIRKILLAEPFKTFMANARTHYMKIKGNKDEVEKWVISYFEPNLKSLIEEYDPNLKLFSTESMYILSAYVYVAKQMLKESLE